MNELGVEEAGVDGGGIFKDFMEGITKTGFDVQYGLFKVLISISMLLLYHVSISLKTNISVTYLFQWRNNQPLTNCVSLLSGSCCTLLLEPGQ